MARITAWRSAALAALAAAAFACKEEVTAPGHCPELCPNDSLVVEDTVLTGVVVADTSYRGYTRVDFSSILFASNTDSVTSYPLIVFAPLPSRWFPAGVDTAGVTLGTIDSVAFEARVDMRDTTVHNLRLLLFRVPRRLDSATTFDSVSGYFAGTPFDSVPVPDTLRVLNVRRLLPVASVTPDTVDSGVIALGIALRADAKTAARLLASDFGSSPPILRYYVHGAAPRDTFTNVIAIVPSFDTYVRNVEPAAPPPGTIVVGNEPAARSFLHFNIPSHFVDSVTVVRATLTLTPVQAVQGIPSETVSVAAQPILRYFGGKSILIQDTSAIGLGTVAAGQTTPVSIEIGKVLRFWRGIPTDTIPRVISLRNVSEDFTTLELRAAGSAATTGAPQLRISFIRPIRFGVP